MARSRNPLASSFKGLGGGNTVEGRGCLPAFINQLVSLTPSKCVRHSPVNNDFFGVATLNEVVAKLQLMNSARDGECDVYQGRRSYRKVTIVLSGGSAKFRKTGRDAGGIGANALSYPFKFPVGHTSRTWQPALETA